jgi:hypothetical protein
MQKDINEIIEIKAEWAKHYEDLASALSSVAGLSILTEIQNKINYKNKDLVSVSLQPLDYPYYEYHRDDLQKMKAIRSQIGVLEELKRELNPELLLEKTKKLRDEIQNLKNGEPLEPVYS